MQLIMVSCDNEFAFRNHYFGDSIEKVKQSEEDDGEMTEDNGKQTLLYSDIELFDEYTGNLTFIFENNELLHIFEYMLYENEEMEKVYNSIKSALSGYGKPDEETKDELVYKALWEKDEYGITLIVMESSIIITFSSDSSKEKKFYSSLNITDLLGD